MVDITPLATAFSNLDLVTNLTLNLRNIGPGVIYNIAGCFNGMANLKTLNLRLYNNPDIDISLSELVI